MNPGSRFGLTSGLPQAFQLTHGNEHGKIKESCAAGQGAYCLELIPATLQAGQGDGKMKGYLGDIVLSLRLAWES